jgi:hypothetical protein
MSAPCPAIATFMLMSGPAVKPWCARFVVTKIDPKTKVRWADFLPMIFDGHSEHGVAAAARAWWRDEQAKIQAKAEHGARLGSSRARKAA